MDEEKIPGDDAVPEEHANEASGSGGADSPEEAVPETPSEKDPDAGPTETADQVEDDSDRDQAEG